MNSDTELLALCTRLQIVDAQYLAFDESNSSLPGEVCRVADLRDALISDLSGLSPVTPEGAQAMALTALPLLRAIDSDCIDEPLIRLITRIIANAAGKPALGEPLLPFKLGTELGPRFALAVKIYGGMAR